MAKLIKRTTGNKCTVYRVTAGNEVPIFTDMPNPEDVNFEVGGVIMATRRSADIRSAHTAYPVFPIEDRG